MSDRIVNRKKNRRGWKFGIELSWVKFASSPWVQESGINQLTLGLWLRDVFVVTSASWIKPNCIYICDRLLETYVKLHLFYATRAVWTEFIITFSTPTISRRILYFLIWMIVDGSYWNTILHCVDRWKLFVRTAIFVCYRITIEMFAESPR